MHERVEDAAAAPATDASTIAVRDFRQILVWPLQLASFGTAPWADPTAQLSAAPGAWTEIADPTEEDGPDFRERHYTEFTAFMPDVQRFLYGEGDTRGSAGSYGGSSIRRFRRRDVAAMRVRLRAGDPVLRLDVVRTELYFFYDIELVILVVEVAAGGLDLGQVEELMFRFGRAYPAAWDADGNGTHCCENVELIGHDDAVLAVADYRDKRRYLDFVCAHRVPRLAAHWAFLLEPLTLGTGSRDDVIPYRLLEHQKVPVLAFIAVDDPHAIAREDWMRLGLAAAPGRAGVAPFAPDFLDDFEARLCYDRFWGPPGRHDQTPTRILCSGQAFVMVGEAGCASFTDAQTGILAQFRHQYFLLAMIAHFHRAALLIFRDRLVSAISDLTDYSGETVRLFKRAIRQTHENFLRFTHRYWFQEVSTRPQARDLFALWVRHLATDRLFTEVREEVHDMMNYLDSDGLRRQANTVVRLTVVTFFGLVGSTVTGFLGMNLIDWTRLPLSEKVFAFTAVLVPIVALTFYTATKSKRLAEFLESVSDERNTARYKMRAFTRVWTRH